jgi:hypothetical protein
MEIRLNGMAFNICAPADLDGTHGYYLGVVTRFNQLDGTTLVYPGGTVIGTRVHDRIPCAQLDAIGEDMSSPYDYSTYPI